MKIVFLKTAVKDASKIKNKKRQMAVKKAIRLLKETNSIQDIQAIKKLSGHTTAYRMRVGDLRIGFYLKENTITVARLVNRKDIYKLFP